MCLEAFSKNFVLEATLQKNKKTDMFILFFSNNKHLLLGAPDVSFLIQLKEASFLKMDIQWQLIAGESKEEKKSKQWTDAP